MTLIYSLNRLTWPLAAFVLALSLLAAPGLAFAHGEEVGVEPSQAKHGDVITVSGKGFSADETLTLALEGLRGRVNLGEVKTGPDGTFSVKFTIPEEATPGTYQLKVAGADETVTLAVSILEESTSPATPSPWKNVALI